MTVNNTLSHQRLILTGDRERFKDLLRRRLIECGWRDQVRMLCRDVVKESEGNNITLDTLVTRVTPRSRALVPDTVKKELLQKIKTHLLTHKGETIQYTDNQNMNVLNWQIEREVNSEQ